MVVFKAHITTGPGGKVLDMFWIYDNRCELPENHRCGPALFPVLHIAAVALEPAVHTLGVDVNLITLVCMLCLPTSGDRGIYDGPHMLSMSVVF